MRRRVWHSSKISQKTTSCRCFSRQTVICILQMLFAIAMRCAACTGIPFTNIQVRRKNGLHVSNSTRTENTNFSRRKKSLKIYLKFKTYKHLKCYITHEFHKRFINEFSYYTYASSIE